MVGHEGEANQASTTPCLIASTFQVGRFPSGYGNVNVVRRTRHGSGLVPSGSHTVGTDGPRSTPPVASAVNRREIPADNSNLALGHPTMSPVTGSDAHQWWTAGYLMDPWFKDPVNLKRYHVV